MLLCDQISLGALLKSISVYMDVPKSGSASKLKLCKCSKCLENSADGLLLKPTTHWRHATKLREQEKMARRTALFDQFGLPAPGASSTGGSNKMQSIKKRKKVCYAVSL